MPSEAQDRITINKLLEEAGWRFLPLEQLGKAAEWRPDSARLAAVTVDENYIAASACGNRSVCSSRQGRPKIGPALSARRKPLRRTNY